MKNKRLIIRALWIILMIFYVLSFVFFILIMNHYSITSPYCKLLTRSAYISIPVVITLGIFVARSIFDGKAVRPCIKVPFLILTLPVIIIPLFALISSL